MLVRTDMKRSFAFAAILVGSLALPYLAAGNLASAQPTTAPPLAEVLERVKQRYVGTVVDADVVPRKKHERAEVVYEVRLLTERGNIIRIRLDARTGEFIGVDGRGFLEALRP